MKIAFILGEFPTLSETFVLNQITGLIDLGHDVEIYAHSSSSHEKTHADIEEYGLLARTHYLHSVPKNLLARVINGLILFITNVHKDIGLVFRSLNCLRHGTAAYSLRMLYLVTSFAGKHYDIIQCHYGDNGSLAVLLKEAGFSAKLVTMFHGWDIRVALAGNTDRYRQLFKIGDCFLSISDYSYQNILKLGANPKKVLYHPVGIDINRFSPSSIKPRPTVSGPIVLTVARLVEEKGLTYGIQAVYRLLQMNPELQLQYQIVGEGPLEWKLKNLVDKLNLRHIVYFLGGMHQKEVIQKMENAHIFVLPSVKEVLPMVLMEAQAMGLPVVATRVGSIVQVVHDGKSGFLVPPGEPNALAKQLMYLIEHPERWTSIGKTGREYVKEHYDIQELNRRLVRIYEDLLI
jgi:colanic acid/amylovoran biosynthesis glycosyltransferase